MSVFEVCYESTACRIYSNIKNYTTGFIERSVITPSNDILVLIIQYNVAFNTLLHYYVMVSNTL